jgi:spore germination cell wall hydrolase CwlJ-like protein
MEGTIDVLARTIYGEARGEYHRLEGGLAALIAIGNVIMNRYRQQSWYGKTIAEVCQKPWQFSCWNKDDPNYLVLRSDKITGEIFEVCRLVAENIVLGKWPDLVKGCDHYHTDSLTPLPKWAVGKKPTCRIGRHLFYRLVEGA